MSRSFILVALLALTLGACAGSEMTQRYLNLSPQERMAATTKSSVNPAGVSTVQYKEMGESARHRTHARLIRAAWGEACDVVSANPAGYSRIGSSLWRVKCRGTATPYDYFVTLPESASKPAQVLPCQSSGPRGVECSVVGRTTAPGA